MNERMLERLRVADWLRALPPDAQRALAYTSRLVELETGEELFRRGDSAEHAYVVLAGEVEVVGHATLGPGELVGELALFAGETRTASVRAVEPTALAAIGYAQLLEIIRAWPDVALGLLRVLSARFVDLQRRV